MTEQPTTDGGARSRDDRDVRRAGDRPPDVPSRTTVEDLLPRLLDGADSVSTGYHVRARLAGEDPGRAAERLVEALERKVTVVGSTLDAGIDPADPQLDVLIECDHTMSQVATALARVAPVEGAIVLDVTAECDHVLEDQQAEEEADAADANDVFNELQDQVSQADYDEVVDELEDVSFPGGPDPDEEVDLESEADVELEAEGSTGGVDADVGAATETIDLEGDDGGDLDTDDVSAEELFGDDESTQESSASTPGGTSSTGEADADEIEEAIKSVEGDDGAGDADDESAAADDGAGPAELDTSAGADAEGTDDSMADPDATGPGAEDSAPAGDGATADDAAAAEASVSGTSAPDETADASSPGSGEEEAVTSGDEEAVPSGDEEAVPSGDEEAVAASEEEAVAAGDGGSAARPQDTLGDAGTADEELGELVDELTAALESGRIGPERRQKLREALGIESNHSLDVRLEYLQKRVDNLAAYTDAWESFLSEEGTGDEFIDDVRDRLDSLERRVEAGDGGADGQLVERVDELETTVDQLDAEARLATVEQRLDDLERSHESDVSRMRDRLDSVEDAIEKLKGTMEQFADWRETVNDHIRGG